MTAVRLGIIGDHDASRPTHAATNEALAAAAAGLGVRAELQWLPTEDLRRAGAAQMAQFAGLLIAPGSPYRSLQGALAAIRFGREENVPTLGTCGGFQHMIVEFARNVLGFTDAGHAEYDPDARRLVVIPLLCSLAGTRATVRFEPGSRTRGFYGVDHAEEEYRCSFGVNPTWRQRLEAAGFRVAGTDARGEMRVAEVPRHRFYVGTLYVPQLSSCAGEPHPLLTAFVASAAGF